MEMFGRNYFGENSRSRTTMNYGKGNKPKKTILVKVSSNEGLPSKSELATKHQDDEIVMAGRGTISPNDKDRDMKIF